MPVPRIYLPDCKTVAQAIQQDLEKVGIRAKLVTYDWGTYVEKIMKWEHPICFIGRTADYIDPDAFLHGPLISGGIFNFPQWQNNAYDGLVEKARSVLDREERSDLYSRAQALVQQEAPLYPIAHGNNLVAVNSGIQGFYLHPTTLFWFDAISLKR
jgi:ABC-type transport system substrate-binding protein